MLKACSLAISTLLRLKKKYQMRRESQCKKNVLQVEVRVDIDHCAPWSLEVAFSPQRKICKKSQCVWRWLSHSGSGDKLQNVSCFLGPVQFSSVAQSCPTLCDPINRSTPGLPVPTNSRSSLRLTSIESVMPSSHLILCRPLLLPPIPPSITVFSNESTLLMRWPKCWSFSFSIIPSKEIPGLISFRMDW